MSIKGWLKERNLSRLTELRQFTLRNIMFFVAIFAIFVALFSLAGGWRAIGMSDFSHAWLAWVFFGLSGLTILFLCISALKWLFSKRTDIKQDNTANDTKDKTIIVIANAIIAISDLLSAVIERKRKQ